MSLKSLRFEELFFRCTIKMEAACVIHSSTLNIDRKTNKISDRRRDKKTFCNWTKKTTLVIKEANLRLKLRINGRKSGNKFPSPWRRDDNDSKMFLECVWAGVAWILWPLLDIRRCKIRACIIDIKLDLSEPVSALWRVSRRPEATKVVWPRFILVFLLFRLFSLKLRLLLYRLVLLSAPYIYFSVIVFFLQPSIQ